MAEIVKRTVIYEGLFIEECYDEMAPRRRSLLDNYTLENEIAHKHVTVAYKPTTTHENFYGCHVYAILRGYGNDGKNEGYLVEIIPSVYDWGVWTQDNKEELCDLLYNIDTPHITVSISSNGRPVDTKYLNFEDLPFEKLDVVELRFGAYISTEYSDGSCRYSYLLYNGL